MTGEMSPNIFCPKIPPLYTTVSIDYLFACTPEYRLFWTRCGGSPDKNVFVAAGDSRGDTAPPGPFSPTLYTTNLKAISDSRIRSIIGKGPKYRFLAKIVFQKCREKIPESLNE